MHCTVARSVIFEASLPSNTFLLVLSLPIQCIAMGDIVHRSSCISALARSVISEASLPCQLTGSLVSPYFITVDRDLINSQIDHP